MSVRILGGFAASLMLGAAGPALAQNAGAPVDVIAAPPASSDTIGPSQLQNFNLQGTVTKPAERPAASAPPAKSAVQEQRPASSPAEAPPVTPGPGTERRSETAAPRPEPAASQPTPALQLPANVEAVSPSLPLEVITNPAPQPGDTSGALPAAGSTGRLQGFWSRPWLAAVVVLVAGSAFIVRSRRGRRRRYGDEGGMAFAGLVPEADAETSLPPPVRPRADPVPPRVQPAPKADPVPSPVHRPAAKPPVDDGLIKSTALKPQLNVQFTPDRAVVTEREVSLQFDVVLTNSGSAPARDVLVEAKLVPAYAGQDQEIAAFFDQPQATGDRMAGIPPMSKVALKSAVRLPLDQLRSFEVEGRKLFVPLVAFNILFRSSGGEGQASASFLVGRGKADDEKLAPFRLDLGPRIFRGLSARPHSLGLQQA